MSLPKKKVVVTDLDNTLFDWVDLWYHCFSAMLREITKISHIPSDELKPSIRKVHRKHGTSEYSFLIEELPILREKFHESDLTKVFAPAIEAYQAERRKRLGLYPGVAETLLKIKGRGTLIVGYTESMAFYSNYRLRRLGLDGVIDILFSPADHDIPEGLTKDDIRKYPASHYKLRYTAQERTPKNSRKPDSVVLNSIILSLDLQNDDCVYVGDSLFKDVAMAQDAGVDDVWAKYGEAQHREEYELLREVTHWTDEDVEREKRIRERDVKPKYTLEHSYSEMLEIFEFGDADAR
jgi:FMN phosphatase YigB (HAD superfamily)